MWTNQHPALYHQLVVDRHERVRRERTRLRRIPPPDDLTVHRPT